MDKAAWFGALVTGSYDHLARMATYMAGTRSHLSETALMVAVRLGDARAIQILEPFENGMQNRQEETALMIAVRCGNEGAVRLLVNTEYGLAKHDGTTALHVAAVTQANAKIVEILAPYLRNTADKSGTLPNLLSYTAKNPPLDRSADKQASSTSFAGQSHAGEDVSADRGELERNNTHSFTKDSRFTSDTDNKGSATAKGVPDVAASSTATVRDSPQRLAANTRMPPQLMSHVYVEMVEPESTMHTFHIEDSLRLSAAIEETELVSSVDSESRRVSLLNSAVNNKMRYGHAQTQLEAVLHGIDALSGSACILIDSLLFAQRPMNRNKVQLILPVLLVNPFLGHPEIAELSAMRVDLSPARERILRVVGAEHIAPAHCLVLSPFDGLISVIVPCSPSTNLLALCARAAEQGVYALLLPSPQRERYIHFVSSFASESLPHAGELLNTRYIWVRNAAEDDVAPILQPYAEFCTVYAGVSPTLAGSDADSNADLNGEGESEHDAPGEGSRETRVSNAADTALPTTADLLIRVTDASLAQEILLQLSFAAHNASFLSFQKIIGADLPADAFSV